MKEHLKDAIETFENSFLLIKINQNSKSPANSELFNAQENDGELSTHDAEQYHIIVAKFLHICKRARIDLELAVTFLCTRVSCPTNRDLIKLGGLVSYSRRLLNDICIIGARDLPTLLI